jgi:hypothetical protein
MERAVRRLFLCMGVINSWSAARLLLQFLVRPLRPSRARTFQIALILHTLDDGEWYSIARLTDECKLAVCEVEKAVKFLKEFGFVRDDDGGGRVIIDRDFHKLL